MLNNQERQEKERNLVIGLIVNPEVFTDIAGKIHPDMFVAEWCGDLYGVIEAMHQNGKHIDVETVRREVRASNKKSKAYITENFNEMLQSFVDDDPIGTRVVSYFQTVLEDQKVRSVYLAGKEMQKLAESDTQPDKVVNAAGELTNKLHEQNTGTDQVHRIEDHVKIILENFQNRKHSGVKTGYPSLDRKLLGGMKPSDLIVYRGTTEYGKNRACAGDRETVIGAGKSCRHPFFGDVNRTGY